VLDGPEHGGHGEPDRTGRAAHYDDRRQIALRTYQTAERTTETAGRTLQTAQRTYDNAPGTVARTGGTVQRMYDALVRTFR